MDDINFEELDKAVNSALKQTVTEDTTTDTGSGNLVNKQNAPLASVASPIVAQRRGQFMDMVHPSSNMSGQTHAQRPSRQVSTVQPLDPQIVETTIAEQPKEPTVNESPSVPVYSSTADEGPGSNNNEDVSSVEQEWPDPLEVAGDDSVDAGIADQAGDTADVEGVKSEDSNTEETQKDIATSPFIEGAETEKRPLGAFASLGLNAEEAIENPESFRATELVEPAEANDQPVEPAEANDQPVEPVDTSEGGETTVTKDDLPVVPTPQELMPEVVLVESDEQITEEATGNDNEPMSNQQEVNNGMTESISQQYKQIDESVVDEQATHPVFDTKDYHQPLTPPAKKGSFGLILSLLFVVILLLGVSIWYAVVILKLI